MDKQNQFKSCSFHADAGDVVHVLVKDLTGVGFVIELNDGQGNIEDDIEVTPQGGIEEVEYGALYNWYAATDARGISNTGWHIATFAEWTTLTTYLGGDLVAGGKLKDLTYWDAPNTGATNETEFNGRGSGFRRDDASFNQILELGILWTADEVDADDAYLVQLNFSTAAVVSGDQDKNYGCSLRLVKDSTTLINGETGTYMGNDDKVYRTICIGTQEWTADNLFETKYRDGSDIPVITDNAAWVALITGAMCYYNNDVNNA
jgi:uncharacterized protein (TIGR02145 family)